LPELRRDLITGRWVIISTDRSKRPSDFARQSVQVKGIGFCAFCAGNEAKTPPELLQYGREGGQQNSPGWRVRVVPNKFPALVIEGDLDRQGEGLYDRMNGVGAHEVIIETPEHASGRSIFRAPAFAIDRAAHRPETRSRRSGFRAPLLSG